MRPECRYGNLLICERGPGYDEIPRSRRPLHLLLIGIFLAAVLGGEVLSADEGEDPGREAGAASATPSLTDDPSAPAEQDSGTLTPDEVARIEEHLDRELDALFKGCICERCLGLGLLFGGGGGSLEDTFTGEWSARPDTLNLAPLAQKLAEEPAEELPECVICPSCCGAGFLFGKNGRPHYYRLKDEMAQLAGTLPPEAEERLRRRRQLADMAYFFSQAVRQAVSAHLPEGERGMPARLRCHDRYEYRLALGATFSCLLECFPTGDCSLERDREAIDRVARSEHHKQVAGGALLLGGARIPGSYLSFAEWVGEARVPWGLLEAVHRQETESVPLEEPDEALARGLLREARDLLQSIRCRRCAGDGIIGNRTGRMPVATQPWQEKEIKGYDSWRTCCPHCYGLGYGMTDALYYRYQRLMRELEKGRAHIRPEVYEEVSFAAREFLLKAFLYSRVAKDPRSHQKVSSHDPPSQPARSGRFVGNRQRVTNLQETIICLVHSFAFRAKGPEVDELAVWRLQQFPEAHVVWSMFRRLEPATIPGTSLTLQEWSRPRSRKEKARQAARMAERSPEPEGDTPAEDQ